MGVRTKVFGRFAWLTLEGIGGLYDEYMALPDLTKTERLEMMDLAKQFFLLVRFILPCIYCRHSYCEFVMSAVDVDRMLVIDNGGKQMVFLLHSRVTKKLWDQEREKAKDSPKELEAVNKRWKEYAISYDRALAERFPRADSLRFWNAAIVFLALSMCDYRREDACQIYRFYTTFSKIMETVASTLPNMALVATAFVAGFAKTLPLWEDPRTDENLSQRLDIVWIIKNHVFAAGQWQFNHTRSSFEQRCRESIVGCKAAK
jgi:hypothetical protein